ncbi:MAG: phosphatase PAP2 family protein [Saprospiraceae bacterium]|nr:phosphatase PAP2 family protein [Saprospiraceae bacterium]
MKKVLSENKLYFICFLGFALIGGGLLLYMSQGDLIFWASQNRTAFTDYLFIYGTRMGEELVYVLLFVGFLFYRVRLSLAVAATGLLTMGISFISKSFFLHDRPALYFKKLDILDQINLVQGVELHTGATSFPSGHTMSAFALFGLLALLLPKERKNWSLALFALALLVALSRVYLVQHFLKDIYLGAWMGVFISLLLYFLLTRRSEMQTPEHWLNRPFFTFKNRLFLGRRKNKRV